MYKYFIAFLLLASTLAFGQSFQIYSIADSSTIWFEGTSTLHDYTCSTDSFSATLSGEAESPAALVTGGDFNMNVIIPVLSIKSSKGDKMDRKMYETLNAEGHPTISYQLASVENVASDSADANASIVKTSGWLSVSGVANPIAINVGVRALADNLVELTGSLPLDMTAFGVKPPKMFLGALKTNKNITVHFSLVMGKRDEASL